MYKLIAIDLDGTLLNSKGEVSERNRLAINQAIVQSVEVVLCSGRVRGSIENIAADVGANNYIISGNGAEVYDVKNKKVLYQKFISKERTLEIAKFCEENSIFYSVHAENTIIASSLKHNILVHNSENSKKPIEKRTNINITENIYEYLKNSEYDSFSKITICDATEAIFRGIVEKLRKIKDIEVLDVAHMSNKTIEIQGETHNLQYYYTETTAKNVNKWNAIEKLIEKLNIKKEEVVTIGDNVNDKEMLENAGLGIAMGNSAPYIKKIGDIVVTDNNSDGVAEAIIHHCLAKCGNL